jgi:RecA/RadA recombinase
MAKAKDKVKGREKTKKKVEKREHKKKASKKVEEAVKLSKKALKKARDDAAEEAHGKKAKKSKRVREDEDEADESEASSAFDPYKYIGMSLDEVSMKLSDADTLDDMQPMSSGSLCLDLVMGGGIRAAWYTNFGPEQSAKTTGALLMLSSAIKNNVPLTALRDFEGSTGNSVPYVTSIMKTNGVAMDRVQLFGQKDKKSGKWLVAPRIRYSASTRGVGFFNWFVAVLTRLPDKKMLENEWWLVYEDNKDNQALYGKYGTKGMNKKYGKGIYIPAPDGGLQGLVVLDSYPNMNPDYKDDEQGDNSLALAARMFSKNLPRVKGYLASKKVAVVGVNQLRDVPMAMYGPSESEPCGKALKYNSDVRLRWYPRGLNAGPLWPTEDKKQKGLEVERSINGGKDRYKYIHVKAAKNKLSEGGRETFLRLWTKDDAGVAHGVDPVHDTIYYLFQTGQCTAVGAKDKRNHLKLNLGGKEESSKCTWDQLKLMILGDKSQMKETCNEIGIKPRNLRAWCFKQMASGEGERLFKAAEAAEGKAAKIEDTDDDDDNDKDD